MTTKQRRGRAQPHAVSDPVTDARALPPLVALTRRRILRACEQDDIEALRASIDSNEVRPLFERGVKRPAGEDPIERLKALSFDGAGAELVEILQNALRQPYVIETRGPTRMFVWPAFALKPPKEPTPDERQVMLRSVRFADLGRIDVFGHPPPMRVGIGADGVWHYFWSADWLK